MTFPWLVLGVVGAAALAGAFARITRLWVVAAVAGAAGIGVLQYFYFHYTSDDAYISYRYARNLADGLGAVWNPDEDVEGYTNFLWVGVLAGLHKLGADIVLSGRWLGYALSLVAALGTYILTRDMVAGLAGRVAGLAATLLLAASGVWALWATAGLETSLFAVLMLAAVILHFRERDRGWFPVSGAVWGLVAMTRPDGLLLVAVSGVFKVIEAIARARRRETGAGIAEFDHVLYWCTAFIAVFVPYFFWRLATYDHLFPNTYYAKVGSGLDQYDRGLSYVASFLQEYGGWLLLLVPAALAQSAMRRSSGLYVATLLLTWLAYTVYVGGDSLLRFRFIAPVLPLFYALIVGSAAALVDAARQSQRLSPRLLEAATAVAVLAAIAFTMQPTSADANNRKGEQQAVRDRAEIGRWLRENVPATTTLAAVPVGAIGYESRLVLIDMLGITDEHIAHRDVHLGKLAAGHEKFDSEYVLDRQPDIIILIDGLTGSPRSEQEYERLGDVFIPAIGDMLENPRLEREYQPRAVEVREGKWFNLLVRDEASAVLDLTRPAPQ